MKHLLFAAFIVFSASLGYGATILWTNTAGGDWFTAANWSPNLVPSGVNTASITTPGTYTVSITAGTVSLAGLNLGAASGTQTLIVSSGNSISITNSGTVGANGVLSITSGGLQGTVTIQPGGQLLLSTAATKFLYALTLINQGTVTWSGGQINGGSTPTTVINNVGLWQCTGDTSFGQGIGGPAMTWTNTGTLIKSGGTAISSINDFAFVNQPGGVVQANTGTLQFGGNSASSVIGGSFIANSPGLININSGTWTDAGGAASGSGTNYFSGGTLNLRTNIIQGLRLVGGNVFVTGPTFQQAGAITNLTLDGSTLHGTNAVGNGLLTVNAGGIIDLLTVRAGGQLSLASTATKVLYTLTLINQGTVTWSGGQLNGGSTPTTVISNGGLWQCAGDNPFAQGIGGPSMTWTNSGTLIKSGGTGISSINDFAFVNQPGGVIQANTGTLQFSGNSASSIISGSFIANSPGLININNGTWTDAGGAASGSGTNYFSGGTLNLRTNIIQGLRLVGGNVFVTGPTFQQAGAITNLTLDGSTLHGTNAVGNGLLTVNAGGIIDLLTVRAGGQLSLASTATKVLYALTLINQGTVTWSGGQLNGGSTPTTVISNGGLWQCTSDNPFAQGIGGPAMTWTNSGTLIKSGGISISSINDFAFVNQPGGVVQANTGTLQFSGNSASSVIGGSFLANSPGVVNINNGTWTDAGGVASGSSTNFFSGGTLNLRTNIIQGLRLVGGSVFVTGPTFQQAGAITNLTLDGSTLHGTNAVGNGLLTANAGGIIDLLTVRTGGQLLLSTTATKVLYALTLINQGTVTWSGGQLNGGSTPTTVISNGGLWRCTGDNPFAQGIGGPSMTWTNSGTLIKSGGTGISQISQFNFANQSSGLVEADSGTLQLPSNFTNMAGTLRLNGGTLQASGTLAVSGGTLDGAGSFGANSFAGGLISPGQSGSGLIGFTSGLNLGAGATLTMSGTGTIPGTQYDQLSVTGAVALGNCTLQVTSLPAVAPGTTFVLIQNDGVDAVSGTFSGLAENSLLNVSGQPFRIHYAGGTGNDVILVRDGGGGPPQFSSGTYSNGIFRLIGLGGNEVAYTIQASTNFVQWTNIGLATGDLSGNFNFNDTNAFRFRYRFYRTTN